MENEDQKLLDKIAKNDRRALDKMYFGNRDAFLQYFKKYNIQDSDIEDIYQESITALYMNGVQGKISQLTSSLKTYLFSIGKNKAIDHLRKNKKVSEANDLAADEYEEIEIEKVQLTKQQKLLYLNFEKLGDSCKNILKLFYYRGYSIQDIVESEKYKDSNTVKSQKSRCIKQLRELVKTKNKK